MTLIEVLAALLLMGSILVALVTARGRLLTQHAEAADIRQAVRATDALLVDWWSADPPSVPLAGRGEVEAHPGWVWTTEPVGGVPDELYGVTKVRVLILDERDPARSMPKVLTQVEVLVPQGGSDSPVVPTAHTGSASDRRMAVMP